MQVDPDMPWQSCCGKSQEVVAASASKMNLVQGVYLRVHESPPVWLKDDGQRRVWLYKSLGEEGFFFSEDI